MSAKRIVKKKVKGGAKAVPSRKAVNLATSVNDIPNNTSVGRTAKKAKPVVYQTAGHRPMPGAANNRYMSGYMN